MGTAKSNTSKTRRLAQPGNPGHLFQVVRTVPVDWRQPSDVTISCRITFSLWRSLLLSSVPGTKLADFMVGCSCTSADEGCTAGAKWKRPKYFVSPSPSTLKCCRRTRAPSCSRKCTLDVLLWQCVSSSSPCWESHCRIQCVTHIHWYQELRGLCAGCLVRFYLTELFYKQVNPWLLTVQISYFWLLYNSDIIQ